MALYVPGDASGCGFGSGLIGPDSEGQWSILYESGMWKDQWREESSNFREADNLVRRVESLAREGAIRGQELYLLTDNIVFESTFYKGYSSSCKLSSIILRLWMVEKEHSLVLHVVHLAGTRMKSWGVDGLSRGDLMEGMLAGVDPLSSIPLAQGANERSGGGIRAWVDTWWSPQGKPWLGAPMVEVTKERMFELNRVRGARLWMPPPAAMETVVGLFNEDRIAHPWNPHVFAVPRVMTFAWRKALGKDADLMFTVAPGDHFWSPDQHEPLIVAVVLPLAHAPHHRGPWVARGTDKALRVQRELDLGFKLGAANASRRLPDVDGRVREMWSDVQRRSGTVLREFLAWARKLPPVQECLVRELLCGDAG